VEDRTCNIVLIVGLAIEHMGSKMCLCRILELFFS
jgi:hypothetical protein